MIADKNRKLIILAKNANAGREAAAYLRSRNLESKLYIGSYAGEIGELTCTLTKSAKEQGQELLLLIVGGDGLLNEVLNHLEDFEHTVLALVPAGSGNDFARALRISKKPAHAVQRALDGEVHCLDYGVIVPDGDDAKQRRFLVSAGAGFDADVCNGADQFPLRKILGCIGQAQMIYTLAAVPRLLRCRHTSAEITADGQQFHQGSIFFAAAMNTCYEGGGYKFCPDADPESGRLDLVTAFGIRQCMVPGLLLRCRKGTHKAMKQIRMTRAKQIEMRFAERVPVHTDGEILGFAQTLSITCTAGKVRFLH